MPADRSEAPLDVHGHLATALARGVSGLLGIEMVEGSAERVELRLRVDERVHQPYGILHGGVSALLAETAASFGAALAAPGQRVAGIELNASHLRAMRAGVLVAVATPVRIGRTVQVWDIALSDGDGRAICRARCTLAVSRAERASTTLGGSDTPTPPGQE